MAKELDDFLGDEEPGQAETDVSSAAVESPEVSQAAEPGAPAQPATPAEPVADDDPVPDDVAGLLKTVQAERAKRNDHKGRADRLEGEAAALRAELEAARKVSATPPPAPAAPVQRQEPAAIPNPLEDPQGYHAYIQRDMWNRSLNMSEIMLRQQVGDDADVDAKVATFKKLADANPALKAELQKQAHPYKFVYDYAKRSMALEEIGDPTAYRDKLAAEIRAQIEAEYAGTAQPTPTPRIQLPQSLGTARSAGARGGPVINIPESFDDILAPARK
jgi:hypothetical protein